MVKSDTSCETIKTHADKRWPYYEYYLGKRDNEKRKTARYGHNCWSGAESLESYKGPFLRDTMHGLGVYRWRHFGPDGVFVTYEGHFYNNRMHGYGVMSYPDGRVFTGLYHTNSRWGPGVESHACLRESVGLWYGPQLVRLIWRPLAPSVMPDFAAAPNGNSILKPYRIMLTNATKTIGEINSAIELLKQSGLDPVLATERWTKLYPKHCTDIESQLYHKDVFDRDYYKKKIRTLEQVTAVPEVSEHLDDTPNPNDTENLNELGTFYAWNNNRMIIHMMKHCYKHEKQRIKIQVELEGILNGPRDNFKPAAKHELDCRTLLMASYLGHLKNVAELINESNVNPNIADIQGNSALIYATCGDQIDVIHFLVEAGAEVNSYNDACSTPLGVALMRLACAQADIAPNATVNALLPQELPPSEDRVSDWLITRDSSLKMTPSPPATLHKTASKLKHPAPVPVSTKKTRSSISIKDTPKPKGESDPRTSNDEIPNGSNISFCEEKRLYYNILQEYTIRANDVFLLPNPLNIPYIFEVNDMSKALDSIEDDKKLPDKTSKKTQNKVDEETRKTSKEMMYKVSEKEVTSTSSAEKMKIERLRQMMQTILQLLADGADPRMVQFPLPALYMATACASADLVHHLAKYGADVNEVYPQALGYTTLDIVISGPFTFNNLDLIRALLKCGAKADRNMPFTLLHVLLARRPENDTEDDIRQQVIELLLQYKCDSLFRYKGRSAVDIAMSKGMDLFDVFIRSPQVDLNAIINDSNQTILVKMFTMTFCRTIALPDRLQMLTNLLLYGADPLIECQHGDKKYQNLFVYAKKEIDSIPTKPVAPITGAKGDPKGGKGEPKRKKSEKLNKEEKLPTKSAGKMDSDGIGDYTQGLDLVIECARLLHIRCIQAKLLNEVVEVVGKYKHRHWVMIMKEIKDKKCVGLWLSAVRCLEIWDIYKTTKKRIYTDQILQQALCIVHYYFKNSKNILRTTKARMSVQDKETIESEVNYFLREHKLATRLAPDMVVWKRPYVTPELTTKEVEKFNVCFECAMPFGEEKIKCSSCKLIAFCSIECMQINIERVNCHPCSYYLQKKFFPISDKTDDNIAV